MKKTLFTALRAMCVGAMTLFAVSCYDDSALWNEVDRLDGRIDSLANALNSQVEAINTKIAAVETAYKAADADLLAKLQAGDAELATSLTALTAKLDALDGTLDGYIESNDAAVAAAIEDYKKADTALAAVDSEILAALAKVGVTNVAKNSAGNAVLTFTDGSTLEVAAYDANANNTGVITTVDVEGVTYWAVIGADGKTTVLDAAVHPDTKLEFKVDPETNELLVAYDGKTWEQTGVIVNDETTINVVTAFKDGEDYVTLTVGGKEYQLPKYMVDNSSLTFGRTEVFVGFGKIKELELTAEGITEYYVMSKPDGWRTNLEGTTLSIIAPAISAAEVGAAELEGELLIHATAENGACKVVKLNVKTGRSFSLEIDMTKRTVSIFNSISYLEPDQTSMGEAQYNFANARIGIVEKSDFETYNSFDEFIDAVKSNELYDDYIYYDGGIKTNNELGHPYAAGVYEEETLMLTIEQFGNSFYPKFTFEKGKAYVIYALPMTDSFLSEDATYAVYEPIDITLTPTIKWNEITLEAECFGADAFYIGSISSNMLNGMTIDDYMIYGNGGPTGGPWKMFEAYNRPNAVGQEVSEELVSLAELNYGILTPSTLYYVWVFPYKKDKSDYTYETDLRPYIYEFTTAKVTLGDSSLAPTFTNETVSYYSISVDVSIAENTTAYYRFYSADDLAKFANDDEIISDVIYDCYSPIEDANEATLRESYYTKPGTTMYLVIFSVTEEGVYHLEKKIFEVPAPERLSSITVELESLTLDDGTYTAVFNVSGANKIYGYAVNDYNMYEYYGESAEKNILNGRVSSFQSGNVENGKVTITVATTKPHYYVWGYNVGEDGEIESWSQMTRFVLADEL